MLGSFYYFLQKLSYSGLVLLLVIFTVSSIIYLTPVDPARLTFGQRSDAGSIEQKRKELGLDQPLFVQLIWYLNDLSPIALHTNNEKYKARYAYRKLISFGEQALVLKAPYLRQSYQTGESVGAMLTRAIPKTLLLALAAISLAVVVGIVLGVTSAVFHGKWVDYLTVSVSVLGYSIPSYVAAILFALIFGYYLGDWTGLEVQGGLTEISLSGDRLGEEVIVWKNLILPALALGVRPIAIITQLTRSAMLDVLSQEYIRTARAKGLSYGVVVFKHALRNALNPVLTAISGWFAALLAGAFFVENVFAFKGLGEMTVTALLNYDVPVVLGSVMFTAVAFVLINLLVDFLYVVINPKVKYL